MPFQEVSTILSILLFLSYKMLDPLCTSVVETKFILDACDEIETLARTSAILTGLKV